MASKCNAEVLMPTAGVNSLSKSLYGLGDSSASAKLCSMMAQASCNSQSTACKKQHFKCALD